MTPGSSRRFKMVQKLSRHRGQEPNLLLSQMTCKQIIEGLGPSAKTVKLVAHQKQGW